MGQIPVKCSTYALDLLLFFSQTVFTLTCRFLDGGKNWSILLSEAPAGQRLSTQRCRVFSTKILLFSCKTTQQRHEPILVQKPPYCRDQKRRSTNLRLGTNVSLSTFCTFSSNSQLLKLFWHIQRAAVGFSFMFLLLHLNEKLHFLQHFP